MLRHTPDSQHHAVPREILSANRPPKSRRQEDKNYRVAAQEQLADEAILVQVSLLLIGRANDRLSPHLFNVLKDHVHMTIEGFDTGEKLAVVAGVDEDLCGVADGDLEERKRTDTEFVLFDQRDLKFAALSS